MSDETTLRDTFAAAALTGVLAGRQDRVEESHADVWAHMAGTLADAMLRERARTNSADISNTLRSGAPDGRENVTDHDAEPAARAEVAPGTGHTTREPLCWCCSGPGIQSFHDSKADAEEYREHSGIADEVEVFQVVRAFSLTDAEREALRRVADMCCFLSTAKSNELAGRDAATLRALLARLGGAS